MNWGDFLPNIGKGILTWLCNKICPNRGSDSAQSVQGSNTGPNTISVSGNDNTFSLTNSPLDNSQIKVAQNGSGQNQMIQGDNTTYNIFLPPEIAEKYISAENQMRATVALRRAETVSSVYDKAAHYGLTEVELTTLIGQPYLYSKLIQIQNEYAKSGDTNLRNLHIDFFFKLAQRPFRTSEQVIYEEAIEASSKISENQFNILVFFLLQYFPAFSEGKEFEDFIDYLKEKFCPFVKSLDLSSTIDSNSDFFHLEHIGCSRNINNAEYSVMRFKLTNGAIMGNVSYLAHLFSRGASKGEIEGELGSFDRYERLLRPCFHDSSKFQLKTLSNVALHQIYQADFSNAADLQRIINFFERYRMDSTDIQKLIRL